jgi:hypothetical protein
MRAKDEARSLRLQGKSVGEIAKITGASKSSVSLWVRDIELTEDQKQVLRAQQHHWNGQSAGAEANRAKGLRLRQTYQEDGRQKAKEHSPLHLIGCMLYWAEGAKAKNGIYFVNADPNMMVLFARFLREEMNVIDTDIVIYIHAHTQDTDEIKRIEGYWIELLNLPPTCLRKTLYKKGSNTRHNVLRNGVCSLRVYKNELAQHIFGAIQEYGGFENPDWLF